MGTKYDMDRILSDALYREEKPDIRLINKLKNQQPKGDYNSMNKKTIARSFSTVAATFVMLLILSTTVLAAGFYLGGFDRLRDLIGPEQAGLLTPVEITNVENGPEADANGATDTNGENATNANGEVKNGNAAGITNASDGDTAVNIDEIRVELVAVGIFDNIVDLYLTLEDLVCNRLDDQISLRHNLGFTDANGQASTLDAGGAVVISGLIDYSECGIVTYHIRHYFTQPVDYTEMTVNISSIIYGVYSSTNSYDIGGDLSRLAATNPSTVQIILDYDMPLMGMDLTNQVLEPQLRSTGLTILEPHQLDTAISINDVNARVSNIGIIDGRLHIQLYEPYSNETFVFLSERAQGDDNVISLAPYDLELAFQFDLDENGNFIYTYERHPRYMELIFAVDLDRLQEYQLLANFNVYNAINLDFAASFEVENYATRLIANDLDIPQGAFSINEVRLSPLSVMVLGVDNNPGPSLPQPRIRINTTNGVVNTQMRSFMRTFEPIDGWVSSGPDDRGGFTEGFVLAFHVEGVLDLDEVISIEVAGETIYFE